ncbi:MAG: hypothetical protein QOK08_1969, partial [Actinomycetota bacterium]|nr:hypothetical protein [Actinomycetota bacterium]
ITPKRAMARIPWAVALVASAVALLIGVGIGAASSSGGNNTAALAKLKANNSSLQDKVNSYKAQQSEFDAEKATVDAEKAQQDAAAAVQAANTIPGDGVYIVGTDIKPGTYRSQDNSGCYWERDRDANGDLGSIIANGNVNGQAVINIKSTDKIFTTNGCSDWTKI